MYKHKLKNLKNKNVYEILIQILIKNVNETVNKKGYFHLIIQASLNKFYLLIFKFT